MEQKIGLVYATVDGQTLKISNAIKKVFENHNQAIQLYSVEDFNEPVTNFSKLIIGSSIRYGVHHKKMIEFIEAHKSELDTIKTAFFSVNLVARKPEKNTPETNPYVIKFFDKIKWKPTVKEVFAGMLDYQKYPFFDKIMIQLIMWMTKGPTNSDAKIEYTNWEKVDEFAEKMVKL